MATASGNRVLTCPKCLGVVSVDTGENGKLVTCSRCGASFQAKVKGRADLEPQKQDNSGMKPADNSLLAWTEDLLLKMIRGVFEFIFVKLPERIYRALLEWFPTLVRLVKVSMLLGILLAILFAPLAWKIQRIHHLDPPSRLEAWSPTWYLARTTLWDGLILLYTALATCGSLWGAVQVRRRHEKRSLAMNVPPPLVPK